MSILRFPKSQEFRGTDSPLPLLGRGVFICKPRTLFLGCHTWRVGGMRCGIRTELSSEHVWSRHQTSKSSWMGRSWREREAKQQRVLWVNFLCSWPTQTIPAESYVSISNFCSWNWSLSIWKNTFCGYEVSFLLPQGGNYFKGQTRSRLACSLTYGPTQPHGSSRHSLPATSAFWAMGCPENHSFSFKFPVFWF